MTIKITMEAAQLAKALNDVKEVARRDDSIPIVNTVLFRIDGGKLALRTSSFDMQVERSIPLDQPDCAFCVDARRFASIVSAMRGDIAIAVEDGHIIVTGGRSRFRLATLAPDDFPALPFSGEKSFDVGADFFNALALCQPATGDLGKGRDMLAGVFVGGREDGGWAAATNGHLLFASPAGSADMPEMILAADTVSLLTKLGGDCRLTVQSQRVMADFGNTVVIAKTLDATYPSFLPLIPRDTPINVTFDADAMSAALVRIALVADDADRTVRIDFAKDRMTLTNRSAGDEGSEEMPCDYAGDPFTAAFRLNYLRAALNAIDADEAVWHLTDDKSPTRIENPKRPTVTAVVMPTR